MSDKPMTDEEYLRARGWVEPEYDDGLWSHPRHMVDGRERWFDRAEAVEQQLAEDRAALAFVLSRTPPLLGAERGEQAAVAALGAIMEEHR